MNTELPHLRALPESAPHTKSGRIVWAWLEIQASLASGRKMHEIWEALQLDGIEMSYGQFRTYVWRIRKRGVPTASARVPPLAAGSIVILLVTVGAPCGLCSQVPPLAANICMPW